VSGSLPQWLSLAGYDKLSVTPKTLQSPTSKEFWAVFLCLYRHMDPNYKPEETPKLEEEVPVLLKMIGYPIAVNKSALQSIGAPHTWPTLLGALHWMAEAIRIDELSLAEEAAFAGGHPDSDVLFTCANLKSSVRVLTL
jgi:SMC interacting uncharacterized protein involved in chromosome segregation